MIIGRFAERLHGRRFILQKIIPLVNQDDLAGLLGHHTHDVKFVVSHQSPADNREPLGYLFFYGAVGVDIAPAEDGYGIGVGSQPAGVGILKFHGVRGMPVFPGRQVDALFYRIYG